MKRTNKIIALFISTALFLSISSTVFATKNLQFSDVNPKNWFYESVTEMTKRGYFSGKGDIVNGIGTFAPNDTMTKAEFITVASRIAFGNTTTSDGTSEWWRPYYNSLIGAEIIYDVNFPINTINDVITREEAAYISVGITRHLGERYDVNLSAAYKSIPDKKAVKFIENVTMAYAKGIITGIDENGTFNPSGTLTRAEGSTILLRTIAPTYRIKTDYEAPPYYTYTTYWLAPAIDAAAVEEMNNGTYKPQLVPSTTLVFDYDGRLEH